MIAGEQPPAAAMASHSGDSLDDRTVFWALCVKHIACNQHMARAVLSGGLSDRVEGLEPCFRERGTNVNVKAAEGFAELPIGGVDEAHALL
jgi:hypothetical protein